MYHEKDFSFFVRCVKKSPEWINEETEPALLEEYMKKYEMYQGEWRIWEENGEPAAITFSIEWSPSNEKPWLGTILVHPSKRSQGIGKKVIRSAAAELKEKGHKILFAGVAAERLDWIQFLSKAGFEQFKMEENSGEAYTILIFPL
ncbi:GNAT family N-acetyltransferase [Metabacillus sp. KIGAM252]|uniref:GNAT family N-acetyltransferase n=2 Tax=Metabacillus flavus TaxID=2823519 RepID=A0ABS5LDK5_9BACI|nr:GNAT family N-acetyltransferase [Metabacillus flavus]